MKPYKGYYAKVEYDPHARLMHGEVEGLRDVITFQATSVSQLQKAFHASVDDYLEFCETRNESPEKPSSGRFVLRVDPSLHKAIQQSAAAEGKSLNAWMIEAATQRVATVHQRRSRKKAARSSAG